jgi:hypothetical protein
MRNAGELDCTGCKHVRLSSRAMSWMIAPPAAVIVRPPSEELLARGVNNSRVNPMRGALAAGSIFAEVDAMASRPSSVRLGFSHSQELKQKVPHLLSCQDRLRGIGNSVLEVVDHAFVEVELHRHPRNIESLVKPDEAAQRICSSQGPDRRRVGVL